MDTASSFFLEVKENVQNIRKAQGSGTGSEEGGAEGDPDRSGNRKMDHGGNEEKGKKTDS